MKRILKVLWYLILAALVCCLAVLGMLIWRTHHIPEAADFDAIIVLGAQVKPDGTPNVQLQWRLDAAFEAWQKRPVPIVVCGAQGRDEPAPEGEVMRNDLIARGVPAEQVLADTASFNTRENLRNAAALLRGSDVKTVCIVTSDYHLPRALALAEDEGFRAVGIKSPTLGGWYRVKNYTRETLSWFKFWAEKLLGRDIAFSGFK